jgi:hypothetical protein
LINPYREANITSEIRKGSSRLLVHVERVQEEINVKKMLTNIPEGKNSVGNPKQSRLDDIKNGLKKMGVTGSRN